MYDVVCHQLHLIKFIIIKESNKYNVFKQILKEGRYACVALVHCINVNRILIFIQISILKGSPTIRMQSVKQFRHTRNNPIQ